MRGTIIKPHLVPRDLVDVAIGLPHGLLFGAVGPLLIAGLVGVVFWTLGAPPVTAFGVAVAVYLAFAVLVLCWTVRYLELGTEGIRFARIVGRPAFVPWADVEEIAPASRREVVRRGWFSIPPTEASPSLTAKGHYRIRYRGGVQYFPPTDIGAFEDATNRLNTSALETGKAEAS